MGANLKITFVVDVEATCVDIGNGEIMEGPNEIIEIGIVKLSLKDGKIIQKQSYPVKPRFSSVSTFCTKLTGWKQSDMDAAPDIAEVIPQIVSDFDIKRAHTWWSYGLYDKIKLSSNKFQLGSLGFLYQDEEFHEVNPFQNMREHFNLKTLLAMKQGWKREKGMSSALSTLNLPLKGRHHNGADDAENTAGLVNVFLKNTTITSLKGNV